MNRIGLLILPFSYLLIGGFDVFQQLLMITSHQLFTNLLRLFTGDNSSFIPLNF